MTQDYTDRLRRAQRSTGAADIDAVLVTPGPDLQYLTGYEARPRERLTCLVLPAEGTGVLFAPALERAAARAASIEELGIDLVTYQETEDPIALVSRRLDRPRRVAFDNRMWAERVLGFRAALPQTEQVLAGPTLSSLRTRKTAAEVEHLREAGAAIDRVHTRMGEWLRPGRTEREVGNDIAAAIVAEGHARTDFAIVASGPNGASPHHKVSDRRIQPGDPVVVDIGGTMPSGYCSDCTRTYIAGGTPPDGFLEAYDVLQAAQSKQCESAGPGVTAESVDRVGREMIAATGYGDLFIHRTGHGIGLETHEEPYIVEGNDIVLEPGMAFSIEPGIYRDGEYGARIEDIVVCTDAGPERLNLTSREVTVL